MAILNEKSMSKESLSPKRILIAEDESNISDFVKRGLEESGYQVVVASDGLEAWLMIEDEMQRGALDLLLTDIRMPGLSGLDLCRRLRTHYGFRLPVLMLTALGTTQDIVDGLQAGADDYLPKPFKFVELVARIDALLRRASAGQADGGELHYADLTCNPAAHQATRGGQRVDLSTKEYRLLEYFVRHQGEVLSRRQILRDVWDKDFDTNTNVVDVYVKYLRTKIDEPFDHKLIHTIVGVGYIMTANEAE